LRIAAMKKSSDTPAVLADPDLVAAGRRGDQLALTAIYTRYSRVVHAILLARVPEEEAGDLTQDVFVAALHRLESLRDGEALGSWLMAMARNRAADYWRRTQLTEELADRAATTATVPPPRAEANQVLRPRQVLFSRCADRLRAV
jgi:RNA polymerase sigma-70 factor (ECF subfamily)